MEQVLQEKFRKTSQAYQRFIEESANDLKDTQVEVEQLQKELDLERSKSSTLQREVDLNSREYEALDE